MHCMLGHSLEKTLCSNVALQSKSLKAGSEEKDQSESGRKEKKGPYLTIFVRIQANFFPHHRLKQWNWLRSQFRAGCWPDSDNGHRVSKTCWLRLIGTDWRGYGLLPIEIWVGTRIAARGYNFSQNVSGSPLTYFNHDELAPKLTDQSLWSNDKAVVSNTTCMILLQLSHLSFCLTNVVWFNELLLQDPRPHVKCCLI